MSAFNRMAMILTLAGGNALSAQAQQQPAPKPGDYVAVQADEDAQSRIRQSDRIFAIGFTGALLTLGTLGAYHNATKYDNHLKY